MTKLLIKLFIKNPDNVLCGATRSAYGKLAGFVGIVCNLLLFAAKLFVGLLFGSVAVAADGVNNLSDASSSVVTLVGFKLSEKPADDGHPFGHARIEYLSGLAVAVLILVIGVELVKTSFEKILRPTQVEFTLLTAIVLAGSILLKLWMALFNRSLGKKIGSSTLEATAADSRNDVLSTAAVLAAGAVAHLTGLQIDGWAGLAVAAFILYSGFGIARDTVDPILGSAPDPGFVQYVHNKIESHEGIIGMHDLYIHDYGPGRRFASCHVEIDRCRDVLKSHDLIDNIERRFAEEDNLQMVIHYDPVVTDDQELNAMRALVCARVRELDERFSIHDFRMVRGEEHTNLIFDMVIPSEYRGREAELSEKVNACVQFEDMKYYAVIDFDSATFNPPDQ